VVLYGCETWSLTLREEHILREFENRVLRRIFLDRLEMRRQKSGENCILRSFITYSLPSIIRMIKENEIGRACSTNGVLEMRIGFW
jgi:hypothetical protein